MRGQWSWVNRSTCSHVVRSFWDRPAQGAQKQALDCVDKGTQIPETPRNRLVVEPALNDPAPPSGVIVLIHRPPLAEPLPNLPDGAGGPFTSRLAPQPERAPPGRGAKMRPAHKAERLRFPPTPTLPVGRHIAAKLDEPSLGRVPFPPKSGPPSRPVLPVPLRLSAGLKTHHQVLRIEDDEDLASGLRPTPSLRPPVEYVMEIDIRPHRRHDGSLRRPLSRIRPRPRFHHVGVEPFGNQTPDPLVPDAVRQKLE